MCLSPSDFDYFMERDLNEQHYIIQLLYLFVNSFSLDKNIQKLYDLSLHSKAINSFH